MDSLSLRDEQFCQAVAIEGLTLLDAYIRAYEPQTEKKTTLSPKASRLAKSEAVQARIRQLKTSVADDLTEQLSYSKSQMVGEVLALARTALKESDRLRAYQLVADLLSFRTIKQESTVNQTSISLSFDQLTMSELLKLANLNQGTIIDSSVVDSESDG